MCGVLCTVAESSRADETSTVLLQSSSSGLSKTTMGIQSKQKIGSVCESFARSLRTGGILSVIILREVIEVHVNQFCFVKIFTHSISLPRNKLNIASSLRNNSPSSKQ